MYRNHNVLEMGFRGTVHKVSTSYTVCNSKLTVEKLNTAVTMSLKVAAVLSFVTSLNFIVFLKCLTITVAAYVHI